MLASLIVALFQVSAGPMAEAPVAFGQGENEGAVVVSANGTVTRSGDVLLVQLRDIKVADQPADPSIIPYASYRACLARKKSDTSSERAGCSEPVNIRVLVDSERPVSLPNRKLTIPTASTASLDEYWLVLEMSSKPIQVRTYNAYSHSQRRIFNAAKAD